MHIIAKSLFLYFRHKLIRTRVFVDKLSLILSKRIRAYLCAPFGLGRIFLSLLLIFSLALQPVMGAISTSKGQEIVGYDYDELGQSRPITAYDDAKRKADQAYAKLIIFATFVPADTDALIAEGILTAVTGGLGNVIGGAGKGSIAAGKIDEAINSAIDVNRGVKGGVNDKTIIVDSNGNALIGDWSSAKKLTAPENAQGHWTKHGSEFPEYSNASQYVEGAQDFVSNPPSGTLTKTSVRNDGTTDMILYNPTTNTFAVKSSDGAPRTMFRPDTTKHGYPSNLDYFNAQ